MVSNQISTANPYEAPLESQLPLNQVKVGASEPVWAWQVIIRDCLILSVSISTSGGIFGMGLGCFFGLGAAVFGGILGFAIAFIPTAVAVPLCRLALPAIFRTDSKKRSHYLTGIVSGALSGGVSVLMLMGNLSNQAPSNFDEGVFLLAGGAAIIGALGGLVGAHWSGSWYRESWAA